MVRLAEKRPIGSRFPMVNKLPTNTTWVGEMLPNGTASLYYLPSQDGAPSTAMTQAVRHLGAAKAAFTLRLKQPVRPVRVLPSTQSTAEAGLVSRAQAPWHENTHGQSQGIIPTKWTQMQNQSVGEEIFYLPKETRGQSHSNTEAPALGMTVAEQEARAFFEARAAITKNNSAYGYTGDAGYRPFELAYQQKYSAGKNPSMVSEPVRTDRKVIRSNAAPNDAEMRQLVDKIYDRLESRIKAESRRYGF